jgi:hypothetical protein
MRLGKAVQKKYAGAGAAGADEIVGAANPRLLYSSSRIGPPLIAASQPS